MNATETIAAAIVAIERNDSQWTYSDDNFEVRAGGVMVAENVMPPDGDLIVRLHTAIGGQLDVLRRGLHAVDCTTNRAQNEAWLSSALIIARSILGEA
jgi:hypothetical protein